MAMGGITVSWDNEAKNIIRYDFQGRWTWEDFYAASAQAFAMTRSVTHRVDAISNFHEGAVLPPNAMYHFRHAMISAPPNRGVNVIVGATTFVKTLIKIFSNLNKRLGQRLVLANSLDDARMLLAARRQ
jgi:hypothetical protein